MRPTNMIAMAGMVMGIMKMRTVMTMINQVFGGHTMTVVMC